MGTKERTEAIEALNMMTKDELIHWISNEFWMYMRPPSKSSILSARYQKATDEYLAKSKACKIDKNVCIKLDELARKLSTAKSIAEMEAIAREAKPWEKRYNDWLAEHKKVEALGKKSDKLHDEYQKQSDLEMSRLKGSKP